MGSGGFILHINHYFRDCSALGKENRPCLCPVYRSCSHEATRNYLSPCAFLRIDKAKNSQELDKSSHLCRGYSHSDCTSFFLEHEWAVDFQTLCEYVG